MHRRNFITILVSLLFVIPLLGPMPMNTLLIGTGPEIKPLESVGDCTTYANNPGKSGSSVRGSGGASCLYTHPVIRVVVTVYDVTAGIRSSQGTNSCPGQSSCVATSGNVTFTSGHTYRTEVSVYFSNSNQYAQSNDVTLY